MSPRVPPGTLWSLWTWSILDMICTLSFFDAVAYALNIPIRPNLTFSENFSERTFSDSSWKPPKKPTTKNQHLWPQTIKPNRQKQMQNFLWLKILKSFYCKLNENLDYFFPFSSDLALAHPARKNWAAWASSWADPKSFLNLSSKLGLGIFTERLNPSRVERKRILYAFNHVSKFVPRGARQTQLVGAICIYLEAVFWVKS